MPDECYCTVVILNFNKRDLLRRSLDALRGVTALPYRVDVIVVDNGSTDGSPDVVREAFPSVRLVVNPHNLGSAQGRNTGLRLAKGEFVLFLDDSTTISPDQLDRLIQIARAHPEAGMLTAMKVDSGGTPLYGYHVPSPSTLGFAFFLVNELSLIEIARAVKRLLRWGAPVPHETRDLVEIPYIGGGIMFCRSQALREVGPMDDRIFIYGEDFDWCYRFRRRGWKILYAPQVHVLAGFGINATRAKRASLVALHSRRYLFQKYVGRRYLAFYAVIALVGLLPKLINYLVKGIRGRGAQDISTWLWLRRAVLCIVGLEPPPGPPIATGRRHAS
ncbi:MAG TPA: glycosyltransferase family 2 protein [bacterium]|nr:glycosyltransferase family 2 protein [bacterium]